MIDGLNRNSSPGIDGITAEHLLYGKSDVLCTYLAKFLSHILSHTVVPKIYSYGIIIPVLKKPTLNPNRPENYRPITLSSTFAKLTELLLLPNDDVHPNQYGFREGRSTSMAASFLQDIISFSKHQGSPLHVASLDAEKCFDRIWHVGLMYKLLDKLPPAEWKFLYVWYSNLYGIVRINGNYSQPFPITRGTRQGSVLSPAIFNIFLDGLLKQLSTMDAGISIDLKVYNSFAYTDDITLFSTSVPGLQKLIDTCNSYADVWGFNFNVAKSKCMIYGKHRFCKIPDWYLGTQKLTCVDRFKILDTIYRDDYSADDHVETRVNNTRRAYYSLAGAGMKYPGLSSEVKSYLWNSICKPTLLFGMDSLCIHKKHVSRLDSFQAELLKQCLGISKRSHHSKLLSAMALGLCIMI